MYVSMPHDGVKITCLTHKNLDFHRASIVFLFRLCSRIGQRYTKRNFSGSARDSLLRRRGDREVQRHGKVCHQVGRHGRQVRTGERAGGHMVLCTRLCCIEIQVRPNQNRDQFLALYLVQRASYWVSPMQKILLLIIKIHFVDRFDTEPVSGSGSPIEILFIEYNLASATPMEHWPKLRFEKDQAERDKGAKELL